MTHDLQEIFWKRISIGKEDIHRVGTATLRRLIDRISWTLLTTELCHTPIDVWIQKMDVDGDGGRREFGLRGQRRGTGSDKGTAANSLSGYHAPGLKKILACLRPWSRNNEARCKIPLRALPYCSRPPIGSRTPNRSIAVRWPSMKRVSGPTIPTLLLTSTTWRHCSRPPTGSRTPNR